MKFWKYIFNSGLSKFKFTFYLIWNFPTDFTPHWPSDDASCLCNNCVGFFSIRIFWQVSGSIGRFIDTWTLSGGPEGGDGAHNPNTASRNKPSNIQISRSPTLQHVTNPQIFKYLESQHCMLQALKYSNMQTPNNTPQILTRSTYFVFKGATSTRNIYDWCQTALKINQHIDWVVSPKR